MVKYHFQIIINYIHSYQRYCYFPPCFTPNSHIFHTKKKPLGTLRMAATSSTEKKPGYLPMCTCKPVDSLVAARNGARRKAEVMSQNKVTSRSSKLILQKMACWVEKNIKTCRPYGNIWKKYGTKTKKKRNNGISVIRYCIRHLAVLLSNVLKTSR